MMSGYKPVQSLSCDTAISIRFTIFIYYIYLAREPEEKIVEVLRRLVRKLPGHNRHLWQAFSEFLWKLSLQSDINMMIPQNIGEYHWFC